MFKYVCYCPNIINRYLDGRQNKKGYQKLDTHEVQKLDTHEVYKLDTYVVHKLDTHEVHKLDTHVMHKLDTHVVQMLDTHEVHLQQKTVKTAPSFVEEDLQESSSIFYHIRHPRGAFVEEALW